MYPAGAVMTNGPLDEMFPDLRQATTPADDPVHPGVLRMGTDDGLDLMFVAWADPGGAPALHAALRPLVEGALLAELSRPIDDPSPPLAALRLLSFAPVADDRAVAAFGFEPADATTWLTAKGHARGEASRQGRAVPDEPADAYAASVATTARARELEPLLRERLGKEIWGQRPGRFAEALSALGPRDLDALERALVPTEAGVLRWIPPACFQALCDAVTVTIERAGVGPVAWAQCDPDEDGLAPPPMARISSADGPIHLPVAVELLRWCVMPRRAGEHIPPLTAWLADRLGL